MKGKFKIWCETNEERDAVLKKMDCEGIKWFVGQRPINFKYVYNAPMALFVEDGRITQTDDKDWFKTKEECFKEITPEEYIGKNECIVIYRKDQKVIALDKYTGKKAEATCNPADDFDFEVGAKLAFERLMKPECKFKVDDNIIGIKGNTYGITKEGWKGKVVKISEDGSILVVGEGIKYGVWVNPRYFALYEKPEIKVGDTVKVVDKGFCFTTYSDWVVKNISDAKHVAKYCYGECVEDGMTGTVVAIADHSSKPGKLLVYFETYCGCYLIGIEGLKKC